MGDGRDQEHWNNQRILPVRRNGPAPNNYHADESTRPGVIARAISRPRELASPWSPSLLSLLAAAGGCGFNELSTLFRE